MCLSRSIGLCGQSRKVADSDEQRLEKYACKLYVWFSVFTGAPTCCVLGGRRVSRQPLSHSSMLDNNVQTNIQTVTQVMIRIVTSKLLLL